MKNCSRFKKNKCQAGLNPQPLSEFYFNKNQNRQVSECKTCTRSSVKKYVTLNAEKHKAGCDKFKRENLEKVRAYKQKWAKNNPDKISLKNKRWSQTESGKTSRRNAIKTYYFKRYDRIIDMQRRRNFILKKGTPRWLTDDQLNEIKWFYQTAREMSWLSESPLEVDHIVPILGKNVTGLHVPWNLQIIPRIMNQEKGNTLR